MLIRRLALLVLCGSALACTISPLPSSTPAPSGGGSELEESRVREVVDRYLHALRFNDVASLRSAFVPDAKLIWVKRDGTAKQLSQTDWDAGLAASAGTEEAGELVIASVDVTSDVAAVKVVETDATEGSVDYLTLVRAGGEWRIANTVSTRRER